MCGIRLRAGKQQEQGGEEEGSADPDPLGLSEVAAATEGLSGAELANLINEAAMLAVRSGGHGQPPNAHTGATLGLPQPALPCPQPAMSLIARFLSPP